MVLKIRKLSDVYDMKVFTDGGEYFGDIEESIITTNKVCHGVIIGIPHNSLYTVFSFP